jgi:two-component system OmpR family sensor kinase
MKLAWPRSLIARILLAEVVTIVLAALLLPPLTVSLLHQTVRRYENEALLAQAEAVGTAIRSDGHGHWHTALSPALLPIFETGYDGRAFTVLDDSGRVMAASLFGLRTPWQQAPRVGVAAPFRADHFVGISLPFRVGATPLWIVVTQDENGPGAILDDVARSFLPRYLAVLLPFLLLLPLVNSFAIRRLVTAITTVSRRAAGIGSRTLSVRLEDAGLPAEIVPLVGAINELVERLETGFRRQAEFSANVAHELRTPLATLRMRLDAIEDRGVRDPLNAQVDRLSHVLSQLRDLASLETLAGEGRQRFDLAALTVETVAEMAPDVLAQGRTIAFSGRSDGVPLEGSRVLVGLALANLIANAARHTPPGTAIEVALEENGALSVIDDGPGIVVEHRDLLTRRFWRADHDRTDSAGIGLSIVQRIMDVHGGMLEIGQRGGRGACFTMRFGAR